MKRRSPPSSTAAAAIAGGLLLLGASRPAAAADLPPIEDGAPSVEQRAEALVASYRTSSLDPPTHDARRLSWTDDYGNTHTACPEQYSPGSYSAGDFVVNNGQVFRCVNDMPMPSRWCGMAGYEPGVPGSAWTMAWTREGTCGTGVETRSNYAAPTTYDGGYGVNSGSSGGNSCPPAYVQGTIYGAGEMASSNGATYQCKFDMPRPSQWCGLPGYAPGIDAAWSLAWEYVGPCGARPPPPPPPPPVVVETRNNAYYGGGPALGGAGQACPCRPGLFCSPDRICMEVHRNAGAGEPCNLNWSNACSGTLECQTRRSDVAVGICRVVVFVQETVAYNTYEEERRPSTTVVYEGTRLNRGAPEGRPCDPAYGPAACKGTLECTERGGVANWVCTQTVVVNRVTVSRYADLGAPCDYNYGDQACRGQNECTEQRDDDWTCTRVVINEVTIVRTREEDDYEEDDSSGGSSFASLTVATTSRQSPRPSRPQGNAKPRTDAGRTGTGVALDAVDDAYVSRAEPDDNFDLRYLDYDARDLKTLIKFDLSSVDDKIRRSLDQATLRVYPLETCRSKPTVEVVVGNWDEDTVTWRNAPKITGPNSSKPRIPQGTLERNEWFDASVKNAVRWSVEVKDLDYVTFRISSAHGEEGCELASKEYQGGRYAPSLVLKWGSGNGSNVSMHARTAGHRRPASRPNLRRPQSQPRGRPNDTSNSALGDAIATSIQVAKMARRNEACDARNGRDACADADCACRVQRTAEGKGSSVGVCALRRQTRVGGR